MERVRLFFSRRLVAVVGDKEHGNISLAQGGRPKDEQVMAPEMPAPSLGDKFQVREGGVIDLLLLGTFPGKRSVRFANIGSALDKESEIGRMAIRKRPSATIRPRLPDETRLNEKSNMRQYSDLRLARQVEAAGQACARKSVATMSFCSLRHVHLITGSVVSGARGWQARQTSVFRQDRGGQGTGAGMRLGEGGPC